MFSRNLSPLLLGVAAISIAACTGQTRLAGSGTSASTGSSSTSTSTPVTLPSAAYQTSSQTVGTVTTAKTFTWNLSTQLMGGANPTPGATFSIVIQAVTSPTGQVAYEWSNPTLTGGVSAVNIQNIGVVMNSLPLVGQTTYSTVNRLVPANAARVVSPGTMVYAPGTMAATDTFAITFGALTPTVFNPPTFTQLTSTGAFATSCVSCHQGGAPQGGLLLTSGTTSYEYLISHFEAVPFNPTDSKIIERMTNSTGLGFMPPSGTLTTGSIQSVSDWITDGAPNN